MVGVLFGGKFKGNRLTVGESAIYHSFPIKVSMAVPIGKNQYYSQLS